MEIKPVAHQMTDEQWMPEARMMAAQCWCDQETSGIEMDVRLAEACARRIAAWMGTGAFHARNEEYWRNRAHTAEAALEAARAEERERCAKACEDVVDQAWALWKTAADPNEQGRSIGAEDCAEAIRNLK